MTTLTRLKLVRMQHGLRQWDLARLIGISESSLSKIETGRIRPSGIVLGKLAAALGVSSEILQEPVANPPAFRADVPVERTGRPG